VVMRAGLHGRWKPMYFRSNSPCIHRAKTSADHTLGNHLKTGQRSGPGTKAVNWRKLRQLKLRREYVEVVFGDVLKTARDQCFRS
jgi:hypothetical protein